MAIVVNPNEVILNSVRYPLVGKVRPTLASKQPEKTVIGDYDLESNPVLSSWAQKDFSRGMLLEEMFEGRADHARKAYWIRGESRFPGEFTPPALATSVTKPTPTTAGTPVFCNFNGELYMAEGSTLSKLNGAGTEFTAVKSDFSDKIVYLVAPINNTMLIFVYGDETAAGDTLLWSSDATADTTSTSYVEVKELTATAREGTLRIKFKLETLTVDNTVWGKIYRNGVAVGTERSTTSSATFSEDIAGWSPGDLIELYAKATSGVTARVSEFRVYGNEEFYWYMTAGEAFTQTNVYWAQKGIIWDGKAFKINRLGKLWYSTTPNAASPTWTAGDGSYSLDNLGGGAVNSLATYNDVSGDPIIYAGTTQGLFAYDFANGKWILTQLETATHATGGKGLAVWRSALYISSGLHIYEYIADAPAQISSVGLDTFDGLPNLRSGEVVAIIKGFPEIYALVDSTYEGSSSYSSVLAYDGLGWRSIYEESATNKNMYSGIVSSVVRQALWFSSTSGVYYITLQRQAQKPKRVTGFTYAASGILITSWFDNNMPNVDKTAVRVRIKTNDCSATETVTLKYRTNHTNTDYGTGWTTVGSAITADGITTTTFGSDAGELFKDIQFRVELARGSTTTTAPIVEWIVLEYLATPTTIWGYQFTVNCTDNYAGKTPTQLVDAIRTATETGTLLVFSFRNDTGGTETYRVRVWDVSGETQTGETKEGHYNLEVVAP